MQDLYAPWRNPYAGSLNTAKQENVTSNECVFCLSIQADDDEKYFILKRYKYCFIILNKYPYNAGHLMVLPLAHEKELHNLSSHVRAEIMEAVSACIKIVEQTLKAEGVNVGLNLGRASGAGIPTHLHFHILPRWIGDTNFLPTLADTKVISFDLKDIYQQLKGSF
jgi:ATP adenylyltransferase